MLALEKKLKNNKSQQSFWHRVGPQLMFIESEFQREKRWQFWMEVFQAEQTI